VISRAYELVVRIKTIEVGLEELVGNEVWFERYIMARCVVSRSPQSVKSRLPDSCNICNWPVLR
jgi:hypothetical protein